jgi:hypothetical protein
MPRYKDYHKILKIERDAGPAEIKQAYRNMAKKYHPDINKSPDAHLRFIEITEAYEILMNQDLHEYYIHRKRTANQEYMRARYEQVRREAKETAERYARMKFEKFKEEQEAFKKSGWHDLILTLRYIMRVLVFPIIGISIALPLISDEVSEHPSGYVMFWLFALIGIFFVLYNWKDYFRIDAYYYHLSDLGKLWEESRKKTEQECYYCPGQKAMIYPYTIHLFRIISIQIQTFGALYGRKAGSKREQKTIRIPRSRKAFIIHTVSSIIKISVLIACMVFLPLKTLSRFSLPIGLIAGGILSRMFLFSFGTRPKVSYLISWGMLIKFLVWTVLIGFFGDYAFIFLFFDPMLEALLRFVSKDAIFIPLTKQYPALEDLFHKKYQVYMELPVLSVMSPLFRWLL